VSIQEETPIHVHPPLVPYEQVQPCDRFDDVGVAAMKPVVVNVHVPRCDRRDSEDDDE